MSILQLFYKPQDDLSLRLIGDYTIRKERCCSAVYLDTREKYDPTPGQPGDVAFVFGPERNGLANDDVERCSACSAIAADAQAASLNLAQAVQVAAYECRLALAGGAIDSRLTPFGEANAPSKWITLRALRVLKRYAEG